MRSPHLVLLAVLAVLPAVPAGAHHDAEDARPERWLLTTFLFDVDDPWLPGASPFVTLQFTRGADDCGTAQLHVAGVEEAWDAAYPVCILWGEPAWFSFRIVGPGLDGIGFLGAGTNHGCVQPPLRASVRDVGLRLDIERPGGLFETGFLWGPGVAAGTC